MKKNILGLLIIAILFSTTSAGVLIPKVTEAQGFPVIDAANLAKGTTDTIWSKLEKALTQTGYALVRNVMNAVLGKLAYDSATWIASGGNGQEALVFNTSPGDYVSSMADAAGGAALDSFAQGFGFDAAKLCQPPSEAFQISLGLSLEDQFGPSDVYEPTCTFSEFSGNWDEFFQDPEFDKYVNAQWDPNANPLGQAIMSSSYVVEQMSAAEEESKLERQMGDFKAKTELVSGYILTPGKMVEQQWTQTQSVASENSFKLYGQPLADAASIFMNTLFSKLEDRIQEGFLSPQGADLASLVAGSSGGTTSGISAATAVYASLAQPNFVTSGTYDVLSELSSCPEDGATSNNCVMGSTLQVATENKWSVQEFLDYMSEVQGNTEYKLADDEVTNPEEGISYRGIIVLKKFRIVPVGWQLAAEFIRSGQLTDNPSLKQVTDCYDACGGDATSVGECQYIFDDGNSTTTDTYSPFCKLVDPNWVLKAPENYCERQAPGPDVVYDSFNDDDDLVDTQETRTIARSDYCADNRGCIQEEKEGVCTAYGYCSLESRIYRSDGNACDESMASCQTFKKMDGEDEGDTVSYLKNSLNYNDCATDPGCKWYCLAKDDTGAFICKDKDTVYNICDSSDGAGIYNKTESCSCSVSETCWVTAGSGGGDPDIYQKCELGSCSDSTYSTKATCTTAGFIWSGSGATCDLGDNCGASNMAYNPENEKCLCTATNSCNVESGETSCVYNYSDGNTVNCDITSECDADYDTYSYTASCSASNVGDSCMVQPGQSECVNDLGNTCTISGVCGDGVAPDPDSEYCTCTVGIVSCDVSEGSAYCTTDAGVKVILGTEEEANMTPYGTELVYNASINLDNNLQECDSDNASCTEYIRTESDTNLLYNSNFDLVSGDTADKNSNPDFFGAYALTGNGFSSDGDAAELGACIGWQQSSGLGAYGVTTGQDDSLYTELSSDYGQAIVLPATSGGYISNYFDTGYALENRTFTFSYEAQWVGSSGAAPAVSFRIESVNSTSPTGESGPADAQNYSTSLDTYTYTYTFPDGTTDTAIRVYIYATTDLIAIDAAQLNETDSFSGTFSQYGVNNVVDMLRDGQECSTDDIGCELFTPVDQEATDIPAQITNRNSADCGDGADFSGPNCNQCDGTATQGADYYVGCDYYQEMPLGVISPLDEYQTYLSASELTSVAERSGYYCANTQDSCLPDDPNACDGDTYLCVNNISLIPSTATECAAADVGCEEYTNMDEVAAGGEGIEYYSYIRPCVDSSDTDIYTYHTWEGSDTEGYAMVLYKLKKSNVDDGPCTSLDLESQSSKAACTNDVTPSEDCEAVYGIDPDCVKYYDDALNIYYRYASQTVSVSDECKPMRASLDQRVYYSIPEESSECDAENVGCRQYDGALSGDVDQIINEDFAANSTEDWADALSTSNESLFKDDYSLRLDSGSEDLEDGSLNAQDISTITYNLYTSYTSSNGETTNSSDVESGATYTFGFWAKGAGTLNAYLSGMSSDYYFTESGYTTDSASAGTSIDIIGDWQYYVLGPVYLPSTINTDTATLKLVYEGNDSNSAGYIDNIILEKSNSQYLIKGSFDICPDYEGCREYTDRADATHYLKSFKRLCEEGNVGCEALINTANSLNSLSEGYLLDNEYDNDDVLVPYDQVEAMIYSTDALCSAEYKGCTAIGLPDVDEQSTSISSITTVYKLLQPDTYESVLCEDPQLSCREYYSEFDGTVYFKDPGERVCEYKTYTDATGVTNYGWFKQESDATSPDCPKQYSYADPSQPLGSLCNSNSGEKAGKKCNNDNDCYPTDWDGIFIPRCVSTAGDDILLGGGGTGYELDHDKDFGWVGLCNEDDSGCSEYIDPNSPNIEEELHNGGFENNVSNNFTDTYFTSGATEESLPDYWDAYDADNNGSPDWEDAGDYEGGGEYYQQDGGVYYDGSNSLKVTDNYSLQSEPISVSRDKLYTFELYFRIPDEAKYEGDSDDYYKILNIGADFKKFNSTTDLDETVSASAEQQNFLAKDLTVSSSDFVDEDGDGYSDWLRLSANLGLGSTMEIPEDTEFIRLIIKITSVGSATSDNSIWFDGLSFKENDKYYLIDYTVDGTTERETTDSVHTCIDQDTEEAAVTTDGSCVAFRDTLLDAQSYTQLSNETCSACSQTPNSDSCRYIINACDTNSVLKVQRDRICSEWMACETAEVITDDDGNASYSCFSIQPCVKMNEDGKCIKYSVKPVYSELNNETDLTFYVKSGDTNDLYNLQNLTGYVKAGLTWGDYTMCDDGGNKGQRCTTDAECLDTGTCEQVLEPVEVDGYTEAAPAFEGSCVGGSLQGQSCSSDADCDGGEDGTCSVPLTVQGYYPYGWMYETGESGAEAEQDLIEFGNFENLYCAGEKVSDLIPCTSNSYDFTTTDNEGHCWSAAFEALNQDEDITNDALEGTVSTDDGIVRANLGDADYFCPNSPDFAPYFPFMYGQYTTTGWSGYEEDYSSKVHVTQYEDKYGENLSIDINNVLQVDPIGNGSGVKYDLRDNIQQGGYYTLSLKGRFSGDYVSTDAEGPSLISIGLHTNNIVDNNGDKTENVDWFVRGNGSADIVFVIDTSDSMITEIASLKGALVNFADTLKAKNLDVRFAVVTMDKERDLDGDGYFEDWPNRCDDVANMAYVDLTDDVDVITSELDDMDTQWVRVDPFQAVEQVANNDLHYYNSDGSATSPTISYRSSAQKYIILLTDTTDEWGTASVGSIASCGDNSIPGTDFYSNITSSGFKTYTITNTDYAGDYGDLAAASGGEVFTELSSADWNSTDMIATIESSIINSIDYFQFNNELKQYTFGPITIEQRRPDSNERIDMGHVLSTDLIINSSDGTSFQVDDVSLLPALEINKDLNLVARSCRAYTDSSDAVCDFNETNGIQHKGWMGYCLESDPTNENRCITWWPVDSIAGEESLYQRQQGGYNDRVDVYTCLVAKGYERVGYCEDGSSAGGAVAIDPGQGVMCQPNSWDDVTGSSDTCGGAPSNRCLYGADYIISKCDDTDCYDTYLQCLEDNYPDGWDSCMNGETGYHECTTHRAFWGGGVCEGYTRKQFDAFPHDYYELYEHDLGVCTVTETAADCTAYPGIVTYSCWDDTGTEIDVEDERECDVEDGTWTDDETGGDVFDLYADTGACYDYEPGGGYYGDDDIVSTEGRYCFYDVDGDDVEEVRSDVKCDTGDAYDDLMICQGMGAGTPDYNCAMMECDGSEAIKCGGMTKGYESLGECGDKDATGGATLKDYTGNYTMKAMRWQMFDPHDADKDYGPEEGGQDGWDVGVITRLPANEAARNINFNEIEYIKVNLGDAGDGSGGSDESMLWGQTGPASPANEDGEFYITNLEAGAIPKTEDDGTAGPWDHCAGMEAKGGVKGAGCYWYGQYDSGGDIDKVQDPKDNENNGYDLVYVYGYSNFMNGQKDSDTKCKLKEGSSEDNQPAEYYWDGFYEIDGEGHNYLDSGCMDTTVGNIMNSNSNNENNPWENLDDSTLSGLDEESTVESVLFARPSNWWSEKFDNNTGGDIYSIWFDFDDAGYLDAVYTMIYYSADEVKDGSIGVELTHDNMISFEYGLRESCAVVGHMVDSYGKTTSWAARASGGGSTFSGFAQEDDFTPWGSISPIEEPISVQWDAIDEYEEANAGHATAWGQQPIQFYIPENDEAVIGGTPYSCIGECDDTVCVGGDNAGESCASASSCHDGKCVGVGQNSADTREISGKGLMDLGVGQMTSYTSQLDAVAERSQDYLEHVFADIYAGPFEVDYTNITEDYGIYSINTNYWDSTIYDDMQVCASNKRPADTADIGNDTEYCGVRPTISDLAIDGQATSGTYPIVAGQSVNLSFTSNVDAEQTELNKVYIDWGDGEIIDQNWDAMPGEHEYTHAYGCGPEYGNYAFDYVAGVGCYYSGRIIITDNWGWCSGDPTSNCGIGFGSDPYYTENECELLGRTWISADQANDYRYDQDVDESVIEGCQSYNSFPFLIMVSEE
ncbi:MAG: vWA domain-containing protein [Patescibacteria group bacterium]|jgi:hypothetical protein